MWQIYTHTAESLTVFAAAMSALTSQNVNTGHCPECKPKVFFKVFNTKLRAQIKKKGRVYLFSLDQISRLSLYGKLGWLILWTSLSKTLWYVNRFTSAGSGVSDHINTRHRDGYGHWVLPPWRDCGPWVASQRVQARGDGTQRPHLAAGNGWKVCLRVPQQLRGRDTVHWCEW